MGVLSIVVRSQAQAVTRLAKYYKFENVEVQGKLLNMDKLIILFHWSNLIVSEKLYRDMVVICRWNLKWMFLWLVSTGKVNIPFVFKF